MPVLTDTLADDIKALTASMQAMREDFAGWKGAVETELHVIRTLGRWILAAFTSIGIIALTGGAGLIWQARTLSAEVRVNAAQLEKRVDKVEGKVERLQDQFALFNKRLDRVQEQFTQLDKRFDRLEAKLDQALKSK